MNETEDQWLACTDPTIMLDFVQGRSMERKLRRFACACCRHVWHLLSPYDGTVVDEVEKCIQEGADLEEVRLRLPLDREASAFEDVKVHDCYFAMPDGESFLGPNPAWLGNEELEVIERESYWFPEILFLPDPWRSARITSKAMRWLIEKKTKRVSCRDLGIPFDPERWQTSWDEVYTAFELEKAWQKAVLHDLFDNLVLSVSIDPAWLSWNNSLVLEIALSIYDECAFENLPILGDALEEAGCTNRHILEHCRWQGEHFPGCWLLDLIFDIK